VSYKFFIWSEEVKNKTKCLCFRTGFAAILAPTCFVARDDVPDLRHKDFQIFYFWNTSAFFAVAGLGFTIANVFYRNPSYNADIFTFLTESLQRIPPFGVDLTGICLGLLFIEWILTCIELCSSSGSGAGSNEYELASTSDQPKRRRKRNRTESRFWITFY